jgi:hypothetical protein
MRREKNAESEEVVGLPKGLFITGIQYSLCHSLRDPAVKNSMMGLGCTCFSDVL